MEYELEYPDGPFDLVLTTSGVASVDVFTELNEAIRSDARIVDGANMLFDHSRLDMSGLSAEQIRAIADNTGGEYQGRGGRIAIVVPAPVAFGLARMWQAMTGEQISARSCVVDSVEAAYAWIEHTADD